MESKYADVDYSSNATYLTQLFNEREKPFNEFDEVFCFGRTENDLRKLGVDKYIAINRLKNYCIFPWKVNVEDSIYLSKLYNINFNWILMLGLEVYMRMMFETSDKPTKMEHFKQYMVATELRNRQEKESLRLLDDLQKVVSELL